MKKIKLFSFEVSSFLSTHKMEMITTIITYVNYYFPHYQTRFYCDNFIKSCLVYKYLHDKYFASNINFDQIIYRLTEVRNSCRSNSAIMSNHLIFSNAFRAFWKNYRTGRGCVHVVDTPFQECEVLGLLTGIVYWSLHRGVV